MHFGVRKMHTLRLESRRDFSEVYVNGKLKKVSSIDVIGYSMADSYIQSLV